jgi:hypothetical protein
MQGRGKKGKGEERQPLPVPATLTPAARQAADLPSNEPQTSSWLQRDDRGMTDERKKKAKEEGEATARDTHFKL